MLFYNEEVSFWLALKDRADGLNASDILRELIVANAKVHYYEQHLKQMQDFATKANSLN